ncbi:MAG: RAMP superfamily CRISPR-associated protein [Chromatiaceae bacterium]
MATQLMRSALRSHYRDARDAHPGLLIQCGYPTFDNQTDEGKRLKTAHIERICGIPASDYYARAFGRWRELTANPGRFLALEIPLETRLFIGLTGGGMLETGCAIAHSYGVPLIPGSSIKGAVTAYVRSSPFGDGHPEVCEALFGREPTDDHPEGLAGAITFHDAWWVPGSAETPLVQEVVTTHHRDYYGDEGKTPATDLDSPIPNAQIAVRGRFLFVLEGEVGRAGAWLPLGAEMLKAALGSTGVGAKTRSGYGYFQGPEASDAPSASARCPWVDDTIVRLMQQHKAKEPDTLRGKGLAGEWQALADPELKAQALADIQARWQKEGWWDEPPGGAARKAKDIYSAT